VDRIDFPDWSEYDTNAQKNIQKNLHPLKYMTKPGVFESVNPSFFTSGKALMYPVIYFKKSCDRIFYTRQYDFFLFKVSFSHNFKENNFSIFAIPEISNVEIGF
jgi:hypothetical protein